MATYAANGNILWKKDVAGTGSNYTYGSGTNKPHAVTSAFGYTIGYDANGLMATRTKSGQATPWAFTWTRSNMVKWIFDGSDGSEYEYDGSDARIKEIRKVSGQEVEKKIFCPGFEQFFDKDTSGHWKAKLIRVHIGAPDGAAGVFEYKPNQVNMAAAQSLTLLFTDHLGSVDLAINIAGSTFLNYAVSSTRTKYSYDPWGERRNETTWSGAHVLTQAELAAQHTDRGFTGHEMLDELGLINMNARIYDPQLGRFLSADSIVQSAGDLQSYNRYSYCGNNPLSRIDPSGHSWLSSAFKGVGDFVSKYWKTIVVIIVTVVVAYYTGGFFTDLFKSKVLGGMAGGACAGFAGGFTGTVLNGGNLSQALSAGATGAAWGALSGAMAGYIGFQFGDTLKDAWHGWYEVARAASHGLASGIVDELRGGRFGAGFASGFVSSYATHMWLEGIKDVYTGATIAAVIGGTASVIGGGKFENGAMYGAFQYLFNAYAERRINNRVSVKNCDIQATVLGETDSEYYTPLIWRCAILSAVLPFADSPFSLIGSKPDLKGFMDVVSYLSVSIASSRLPDGVDASGVIINVLISKIRLRQYMVSRYNAEIRVTLNVSIKRWYWWPKSETFVYVYQTNKLASHIVDSDWINAYNKAYNLCVVKYSSY